MATQQTRARRNGAAPEQDGAPEQVPAPAQVPEPALDIAALAAAEEIARAQRVYVDVPGVTRVPTADGTLAAVQRERRADGTLGEYMLAEIRAGKQGQPDQVQRYPIARVQALKSALDAAGVTILH